MANIAENCYKNPRVYYFFFVFTNYLNFELVAWNVNPCCDNKKSVILATKLKLHEYKQNQN